MKRLQLLRRIVQIGMVIALAAAGIGLSVLLAGGSKLLSAQSGSMDPAIKKGGLVSVKRTPARDLRVGDVITFTSREDSAVTVTHRIVSITGDMQGRITTKGDANETPDKAVVPSQIVGRVEHHIPYAGFLVDFIKHPLGLLLIIYLPALVLIISEVQRLSHYYKQRQPYRLARSRGDSEGQINLHVPTALAMIVMALSFFMAGQQADAALVTRARVSGSSIEFMIRPAASPVPQKPVTPMEEPAPEPSRPARQRDDHRSGRNRSYHRW